MISIFSCYEGWPYCSYHQRRFSPCNLYTITIGLPTQIIDRKCADYVTPSILESNFSHFHRIRFQHANLYNFRSKQTLFSTGHCFFPFVVAVFLGLVWVTVRDIQTFVFILAVYAPNLVTKSLSKLNERSLSKLVERWDEWGHPHLQRKKRNLILSLNPF